MYSVYSLIDKNDENTVYYGITRHSPEHRYKRHKNAAKSGKTLLYAHMRKNGRESMSMEVLKTGLEKSEACELEMFLIKFGKQFRNVLNTAAGGEGCAITDDEVKKRLSVANKNRMLSDPALRYFLTNLPISVKQEAAKNSKKTHQDEAWRGKQSIILKDFFASARGGATKKHFADVMGKKIMRVQTGEVFASIREASRATGGARQNISEAIKKGYKCMGTNWAYVKDGE